MTSQLGTHYKGAILPFTSDCMASEMEGKLNPKTDNKSWLTVLCCRRQNKVSCKSHSNTPGIFYAHLHKGDKTKTKMVDLRQDSQTGQPTEYFALCSEHIEASCFSRSVLIGTPVDFKLFYLEKGSVPSKYAKPNRFFPEKCSSDVSLGPYQETSVSNPPPPPQKKKENIHFQFQIG